MNKTASTLPPPAVVTDGNRKLHREHQQLSLRELARRMKISAPYLLDLELGHRAWSDTLRSRWDKAMGRQK